jgi:hypothetical protein
MYVLGSATTEEYACFRVSLQLGTGEILKTIGFLVNDLSLTRQGKIDISATFPSILAL